MKFFFNVLNILFYFIGFYIIFNYLFLIAKNIFLHNLPFAFYIFYLGMFLLGFFMLKYGYTFLIKINLWNVNFIEKNILIKTSLIIFSIFELVINIKGLIFIINKQQDISLDIILIIVKIVFIIIMLLFRKKIIKRFRT